jgi:hypothetical protein
MVPFLFAPFLALPLGIGWVCNCREKEIAIEYAAPSRDRLAGTSLGSGAPGNVGRDWRRRSGIPCH